MSVINAPLKYYKLVALMHVAIGDEAHHTNRQNEIPLGNVQGGILDTDEGNKRTFPILDALASICVSEPVGQVVAIGLQWKPQDSKICLTIAENRKVQKTIIPYLTKVWGMLRELSTTFAKERFDRYPPGERLHQQRRVSPLMPQGVGRDVRIALFRSIYIYTLKKNQHRVDKWFPRLEAFMQRFYRSRDGQLSRYERDLDLAFHTLKAAFRDYHTKPSDKQDAKYWRSLHALFEVATARVTQLTRQHISFCDIIVAQVGIFVVYSSPSYEISNFLDF